MKYYNMTIYDNSRMYIQINQGNPFKSRTHYHYKNNGKSIGGYMSVKSAKKTIRRWYKKVISLAIDCDKCKFVTLTLAKSLGWDDLIQIFQIFINALKRKYDPEMKYIRAVEIQKKSLRYHIHIVLVFDDKVPQFKRKDIQALWKYGNIDIENKVYNVYGIVDYLTLNKSTFAHDKDGHFTYYPRNAKIIASTIKTSADKRKTEANEIEIQRVIDYCMDNDIHIRFDKHAFYENGVKREVLDGISLAPGKDYIINNFGTKEDDFLLEKEKNNVNDI